MNIINYNLLKYQSDNKLNNKILAERLDCSVQEIRQMKKESYTYSEDQIQKIAKMMFISEEELKTEMNERINLKDRKIYGTDYLFVNYKVLSYKKHNINLISAIVDLLYFVVLGVLLLTNMISLGNSQTPLLNVLKIIFVIELFVFPFMFIVLPLLKVYFNRTYEAVLTSNVKEYYQEEACGIIFSCLRRSINKSGIPFFFTLFSEAVIALYSLLSILNTTQVKIGYIIMVGLFILSLTISIYSFKYHFSKNGNIVKKEQN
jgi:hypothetical protein